MENQIRNLDYECYERAVREHNEYRKDWLKTGYAPQGFYLKDFSLLESEGLWHLFHIAGTPGVSCCLPGNEIWFGHATTKDFQTWQTHHPCFYIDPNGWDCGHVFAPFVLEEQGIYWMFYTGVSIENTQRIGVAISTDLFQWCRVMDEPVIRPEEYDWAFCPTEKGAACRDPHVCHLGDTFYLYYTAVTKNGRGCVACARSTNLLEWTDCGPAYVAPGLAHCESSNMQPFENRYLLFFGGHYENWSYVVSDDPTRWSNQDPIPLKKGITAMEVISKNEKRWLVAYFKSTIFRMFLGILDWDSQDPTIEEITAQEQLSEFDL